MTVDQSICPSPSIGDRIYLREEPPEYGELYALAQAHIDEQLPYDQQRAAAEAVLQAALALPVGANERARYYAQGLITCFVAQELVGEDTRERAIQQAVGALLARHDEYLGSVLPEASPGLRVAECIEGSPMSNLTEHRAASYATASIREPVTARYLQTPFAERVVADALLMAAVVNHNVASGDMVEAPDRRDEMLELILNQNIALQSVIELAFQGAEVLLMSAFLHGADSSFLGIHDSPLSKFFKPAELVGLIPSLAARRGASFRLDLFHSIEGRSQLTDGKLDIPEVPRPTGPPPGQDSFKTYLHEEPLVCPAMEARAMGDDGELKPLVPLVAPMIAEIILRAEKILTDAEV